MSQLLEAIAFGLPPIMVVSNRIPNMSLYFGENNVILLSDYLIENEKVSSTKIRKYLDNGNIKQANKFLGRKYELVGKVVEGLKMGS